MPIFIRLIITFSISLFSIILYKLSPCPLRKSCTLAMVICSVGDIFMVSAPKLGTFSTYIGAGLFVTAHIIYGGGFYNNIKEQKLYIFNSSFRLGFIIMLATVVCLAICEFFLADEKKPIMFVLIILYIFAIGYNVCSMFSYSKHISGLSLILPPAVILFYITDIFIFLDMLGINSELRKYVWYLYPIAQLAIVLFNSPIKNNKE